MLSLEGETTSQALRRNTVGKLVKRGLEKKYTLKLSKLEDWVNVSVS